MRLILVHAVLVQIISYALRPSISYALLEAGYDGPWLAVATTCFALPPLLLAIYAGKISDTLGERVSIIIGGVSLLSATACALFFHDSLIGLLTATVLLGIGVLFSVIGQQAWVMRGAPAGRLDFVFGIYTFATSTGQMVGPLLLALPSGDESPPIDLIFTITTATATLGLVLAFFVKPRVTSKAKSPADGERTSAWRLVRQPGVIGALAASSLTLTSLDILLVYLPQYAQERGFAPAAVSLMLVVRGAATMASRLLLSRLTGRFGRRWTIIASCLVVAAALMIVWLPLPVWVLVVSMGFYGFALGTIQPLTMSWMTLITHPRDRGMASSLRVIGNRVGQTTIPLIVAPLSLVGGAATVIVAIGALLIPGAWMSRHAPNDGDSPQLPDE